MALRRPASLVTAWARALEADPVSAFGGVVAVRGTVDAALADELTSLFLEVVVAEGYDARARDILAAKPDLRLLLDPTIVQPTRGRRSRRAPRAAVCCSRSPTCCRTTRQPWRTVSQREPDTRERADLEFAWRIVRHVKSNAIVLARDAAVVGVGAGQMNRVQSARLAVEQAGEQARGAVCASDAFFPFADGVETVLAAGVTAVIEPGGSRRDEDVIAAVDAAGAAMVFTGRRHFRH